MKVLFNRLGSLAGYVGILFCIVAAIGRLFFYSDKQEVFGFQAINLFIVGVGLLALGTWMKLEGAGEEKQGT